MGIDQTKSENCQPNQIHFTVSFHQKSKANRNFFKWQQTPDGNRFPSSASTQRPINWTRSFYLHSNFFSSSAAASASSFSFLFFSFLFLQEHDMENSELLI